MKEDQEKEVIKEPNLMMTKIKTLCKLFLAMLKTGLFTFGGGAAMISLLENEFVNRKKWMTSEEFADLVVIAESTPGPIAINCATYIGYKTSKIIGSVVATIGMVIPSFTIIYLISLFFNRFLEITWVASAFKGIQVCVIFLILSAGLKIFKKVQKNLFSILVMVATFICMIMFSLFSVTFSAVFYVLVSGCLGLLVYAIGYIKGKKSDGEVKK